MLRGGLLVLFTVVLVGCSAVPPAMQRIHSAERLASAHGWHPATLDTDSFEIRAFVQDHPAPEKRLTVYIEGDGLAWETLTKISEDPTPTQLMGLKLALNHPDGNAAYLARPCQFVKDLNPRCRPPVWTGGRFSSDVVQSMNEATSELKAIYGASQIELVGYSGGGAIAALVAAQRTDVVRLITIAGTLDHKVWTEYHNVTPLHGSLNPADFWQALRQVPQVHLVGGSDTSVPKAVVESYLSRFPPGQRPPLEVIHDFDHLCCWDRDWRQLYPRMAD